MEAPVIIGIIALIILIAVYNGLFIINDRAKWKATGWVIRVILVAMLWWYAPPWVVLLGINLAWTGYDMIIRLIMRVPIWHHGITSWTEKILPAYMLWGAKLFFFVIFVIEISKQAYLLWHLK